MPRFAPAGWLLLLSLAALAEDASAPTQPKEDTLPVVLLTGFEPFGEYKHNASWETVRKLDGQQIAGHRIAAVQLPVVYDRVGEALQKALDEHRPAAVLSFGVSHKALIKVELVARNGYTSARSHDNEGQSPPRRQIVDDAPAEQSTALPAEAIVAALKTDGIGAGTSTDAGGYICNECFFRLMLWSPDTKETVPRGFIHVPDFGVQDEAGGAFTPEKLERAARIAVAETLKTLAPESAQE